MGREDLINKDNHEKAIGEFVANEFRKMSMDVQIHEVEKNRSNIIGILEQKNKPLLLLDSHLDTVPVDHMDDPFNPVIKNNNVFGRGSCDTKSTMAMFITALKELQSSDTELAWSIILTGTVDEEFTAKGAYELIKMGLKPDYAIAGEPTELKIIHAHKGVVRFHIETRGKSFHSSKPQLGINAFYTMADIIQGIKKLSDNKFANISHDLLGSPTINPGVIKGGTSVNMVPDACVLDVDIRIVPGYTPDDMLNLVKESIAHVDPADYTIQAPYSVHAALITDKNSPFCRHFMQSCKKFHNKSVFDVVTFGTNGTAYSPAGIPTIVFGPGTIDVAHTPDEHLPIDELELSIRILKDFLIRGISA